MGFEERLNAALDRLLSPELLNNSGAGNDAGFHVFDYPPDQEPRVRLFIQSTIEQLTKQRPGLRVCHSNLFQLLITYLKSRNFFDKACVLQGDQGDQALFKALKTPLKETHFAQYFIKSFPHEDYDLFVVSGVGNAWPLLRSHTLLNNLHTLLVNKPLVLFYPGQYDGLNLRLFGRLKEDNYYRALRLVP